MEGIGAMGFSSPTPIQEQAIPAILEGKDVIGSAQTGTGKTAAFLLPVIQNIIASRESSMTRALVIVPTRELAMQIDQQMEGFSYFTPVTSIAVYGGSDGTSFSQEKKALTEGAEVVICTPGRMIAHLNNNYVKFDGLKTLILGTRDPEMAGAAGLEPANAGAKVPWLTSLPTPQSQPSVTMRRGPVHHRRAAGE